MLPYPEKNPQFFGLRSHNLSFLTGESLKSPCTGSDFSCSFLSYFYPVQIHLEHFMYLPADSGISSRLARQEGKGSWQVLLSSPGMLR